MKIFKILDDSLKDNATGQYSHARVIAMLVAIAATIFMWKLILLGGMNLEYFIAYLSYGTGAQTLNKFLDNRDHARTKQAEAALSAPPKEQDEEELPKPPKK